MYILAIDTSCDDTSVAVIKNQFVLSNVSLSQIKLHRDFGGVVPSIAKLEHQRFIDSVVNLALRRSKITLQNIDLISVTIGPGLAIALEVGIAKAKELSQKFNIEVLGINHMMGHFFSSLINKNNIEINYEALGLLVSGGHTELIFLNKDKEFIKIGETLDDACGECLDKCGRVIGLGYPAGPVVAKLAEQARQKYRVVLKKYNTTYHIVFIENESIRLPVPMIDKNNLNMSFSGLKTAFINLYKKYTNIDLSLLCLLLEESCNTQILFKLIQAIKTYSPNSVYLGGGVVSNNMLRKLIRHRLKNFDLILNIPDKKYCTDNAAMIGLCGYILKSGLVRYKNFDLDRLPNLSF